jgi:hypothetical protein
MELGRKMLPEEPMVDVTERALPKLRDMQKEGKDGDAFRVVFKGFG